MSYSDLFGSVDPNATLSPDQVSEFLGRITNLGGGNSTQAQPGITLLPGETKIPDAVPTNTPSGLNTLPPAPPPPAPPPPAPAVSAPEVAAPAALPLFGVTAANMPIPEPVRYVGDTSAAAGLFAPAPPPISPGLIAAGLLGALALLGKFL